MTRLTWLGWLVRFGCRRRRRGRICGWFTTTIARYIKERESPRGGRIRTTRPAPPRLSFESLERGPDVDRLREVVTVLVGGDTRRHGEWGQCGETRRSSRSRRVVAVVVLLRRRLLEVPRRRGWWRQHHTRTKGFHRPPQGWVGGGGCRPRGGSWYWYWYWYWYWFWYWYWC